MATADHHDHVVRDSFRHQVGAFLGRDSVYARRDGPLAWIAPLDESMVVLDVACGAAHAAESVAPAVRQVTGIDLTPELLDLAAARIRDANIGNVTLVEGNAQRLPFNTSAFDVTFCRSSLHHFADPGTAVREMARVTRPGGRLVLVDLIAPDGVERERFDHLHRLLDPSHVRSFRKAELDAVFPPGSTITHAETSDLRFPIHVAVSEHSDRDAVMTALEEELAGGPTTGFRPARDGDAIVVSFLTRTVHGTRPPGPGH